MDSISQFVLGAAVGEAVLGKRLGNKAMMWGGIAGTIPDLDVILSPFMSEVDALAFHRGISHSISFAIIGAYIFGWLLHRLYYKPPDKRTLNNYAGLRSWQFMFFLGFLTHSLLDCFTMYGTQLFAPFTNYRLAFSTISVADPMYTLPFMTCLLIAAFLKRGSPRRLSFNYAGIAISCLYLTLTVLNKIYVKEVYREQLEEQSIDYDRFILGPTILNNILWSATVDAGSFYYQGQYSLFDKSPIKFNRIEKNHNLIQSDEEDRTIRILKWFTNDYYNVMERKDGRLQFNDLRYGTFKASGEGENDYVFRFILERENDAYIVKEAKGGPEPGDEKQLMAQLLDRIKGN